MTTVSPTPYLDVNEILNLLLTRVKEILGDQFAGMYLFGSLSTGDFDQHSDIDVMIVTDDKISESEFAALRNMHERIAQLDSPWAVQLEISYIPRNALRRFDRSDILHPRLDRGNGEALHMMAHESDWLVQRHILREHGIALEGPDPRSLIDPISPDQLRQAVADVLPLWADPVLNDPSQINKRGYQSFFVLSLCRMLYTLQHGAVISKQLAAGWGMDTLEAKWKPLIERAWIGRQHPGLDAQPEDIAGTLDLIRYTLQQIKPTPYRDVNEVLNLLLSKAKEILREQFIGMYLYGSLSSGDFNPETSDIDFLFVTAGRLSDEAIGKLGAMHDRIWGTGLKWAAKLEGAYVPRALIRRHNPNGASCPVINEGKFYVSGLGSDWIIQRHVVREHGTIVEGPDPRTLIDPVGPDDIRSSILGVLHEWWFPMLDDPAWLCDHEDGDRAFAVITMCRVLHALEEGTIVSKPKAVQWAHARLDEPWKKLIDKAMAVSQHQEQGMNLDETLDFIQFTMEHIKT